ncbi:MAG: iron-sulfur cluster assembly protein [Ignavibacteriaceae bacterium]
MLTETQILENLKSVIDPEIGINIVDLGLIYRLEIGDKKISIDMTLTTPGCPMHSSMTEWVRENLTRLAQGAKVDVNLVWEPRWLSEFLSAEAKSQLGY